jgi:hypothetical protein
MTQSEFKLDMSMMFAVHDALRRDLVRVARLASLKDDNPGKLLHAAMGWELFKKFLVIHHASEDETVWPVLRAHVAEQPDKVALVEAMETEHAAIDPLLEEVDAAAADPDYGHQRFGDLVDALATTLSRHLSHEESAGLALIDASLTPQEWKHFSEVHREKIGNARTLYMPWLLDQASDRTLTTILGGFPEQLLTAYHEKWGPDYAALDLWGVRDKSAS